MNADEKACPRCAETIKRAAVVCRYCGHEFGEVPAPAEPPSTVSPGKPKGILIAGVFVAVILIVLLMAQGRGTSSSNTVMNVDENLVATDMNATADVTGASDSGSWAYDTSSDEVRGKTIYYANLDSENEVNFDPPYAGGSTLKMTVRKHPQYGQDVVFRISDGQFVCGVEGCSGTINYGRGPEHISLTMPADYDSKTLFASSGPSVIAKLKSAKKVVVELPFYQEGNQQFTFETRTPLTWPPKGS